ncbi:MAG: thioredoxin family protein [Ginsengibacter sp.]
MKCTKLFVNLFLLILTVANGFGQTNVAPAELIVKSALAEAAKTHKNVFIIFHASWCGWCYKMEDAMNDKNLKSFFDNNYVVAHLTVDESKDKKELENPGANELRKKYHGDMQGIPYWFILNANGQLLADSRLKPAGADVNAKAVNVGCPASNEEVTYFAGVLKRTSSLNDEQLTLIQKRFLKNKE